MNEKVKNGFTKVKGGGTALKTITMIFLIVQFLIICFLPVYMHVTNLFPGLYIVISGCALFAVWIIQLLFLYRCKSFVTAKRILCILISLLSIVLVYAVFWHLNKLVSTINNVAGKNTVEANTYTVRVLDDSSIREISDLKGKQLGICDLYAEEELDFCKSDINSALDSEIETESYDDIDSLTTGLTEKNSDAILFDESKASMVEENNPGFIDKTRVIYEIKLPSKAKPREKEAVNTNAETFNVLITGIDTRSGSVTSRGNSDVNIIATINPKQKKILLTNTPRDYYVPLEGDTSKMDKLTHAGGYGPECSMKTLSALYDTPIDLYIKTNFTSVERIVDAFGGVTVDSDTAFTGTLRNGQKVRFSEGTNNLNGASALAYARERKSFGEGDRARGKHQQQIITALINKIASSSMLQNYSEVLDIIQSNTASNMSTEEMTELIKMQLESPGGWDVESISVDGSGQSSRTYSYRKQSVYVMVPDQITVNIAKEKINSYF